MKKAAAGPRVQPPGDSDDDEGPESERAQRLIDREARKKAQALAAEEAKKLPPKPIVYQMPDIGSVLEAYKMTFNLDKPRRAVVLRDVPKNQHYRYRGTFWLYPDEVEYKEVIKAYPDVSSRVYVNRLHPWFEANTRALGNVFEISETIAGGDGVAHYASFFRARGHLRVMDPGFLWHVDVGKYEHILKAAKIAGFTSDWESFYVPYKGPEGAPRRARFQDTTKSAEDTFCQTWSMWFSRHALLYGSANGNESKLLEWLDSYEDKQKAPFMKELIKDEIGKNMEMFDKEITKNVNEHLYVNQMPIASVFGLYASRYRDRVFIK